MRLRRCSGLSAAFCASVFPGPTTRSPCSCSYVFRSHDGQQAVITREESLGCSCDFFNPILSDTLESLLGFDRDGVDSAQQVGG